MTQAQAEQDIRLLALEEKIRKLEQQNASFSQYISLLQVDGIEIGANFFRGEQGFFQMNVGLEQRGGLIFVDEFIDQDQIGSYSPLNSVEGRADGVITHLQLVSRDTANATALLTIRGKATTVIEGQAFDGTNTGKFQLYPTYFQIDTIPMLIGVLAADPSSLADGMVWYRSDTDKFRGRINGATENLATEGYADAAGGGMKTSGGGYYLIPAGPAQGTSVTTSATDNAYGSWAELRSASGNALFIVGVAVYDTATPEYLQIDIGTGGAGSEASISEIKVHPKVVDADVDQVVILPFPVPVAANTRIACRSAGGAGGSTTSAITLYVIDQADLVSI